MRRQVFLLIVHALKNHSLYFQMRYNASRRSGISSLQRCTVALRMLAYEVLADYVDENVQIGETTTLDCLINFVRGVDAIFSKEYLGRPSANDIQRLLNIGEARGLPGMLESIDCMH